MVSASGLGGKRVVTVVVIVMLECWDGGTDSCNWVAMLVVM